MPTRAGLGMLVSAIVLATIGWRARYAELVAVAVAGLLTLVVAALIVRRAPAVTVGRGPLPSRVERGTEIRVRTKVTPTSRRGSRRRRCATASTRRGSPSGSRPRRRRTS